MPTLSVCASGRVRAALAFPPMPIAACGVCMYQCRAAAESIMPFIVWAEYEGCR